VRAVALLLFGSALAYGQFRAGVSLVRVDAEVVDANGRVVTGLAKDDFRMLDEGMPQTLVNFNFAEDPLDLILLFDTSGGMKGKILSIVRATELGFNELKPGDRVSVRAFENFSTEVLRFSDDLQEVNTAILVKVLSLRFTGASKFELAADEAAQRFHEEVKTRRKRAVLIITDRAGARLPNEDAIVRDFWGSDAVLSELILGSNGANAVVDKTGGLTIATTGIPGDAFRDSVHYLRSGYAMYYQQPDASAGSRRKLEVQLTEEAARRFPGARVHARVGYVVPQ
jgi:Ca-activated chloride channel family protein